MVRTPAGRWKQDQEIDWQVTPAKVEGVIEKRIGRLDRELREALGIASVQGDVFTAEAVAHVQGIDKRVLVRRLSEELVRQHRLVQELGAERVGQRRLSQFRFRHVLIQRYLYQRRGASERIYLHEALGNALEELVGDQDGRMAVQLARHFDEAGLTDKAIVHLQRAGQRALRLSAYKEAVGHLSRALKLAQAQVTEGRDVDALTMAHLERLLGEATYGLGDIDGSRDLLERSVDRLGRPMPRDGTTIAISILGQVGIQILHRILPLGLARASGRTQREAREAAGIYKTLTELYINATESTHTLYAALRGLNLAETAGPSPELARAYADMPAMCPLLGLRSLAETYRRLATQSAESIGVDPVIAYVQMATSVFTVGEGRWEESERALDRSIVSFRLLGDWSRLGLSMVLRTHVHIFKGEFKAFRSLHREIADLAERSGNYQHMIWSRDGDAESLLRLGSVEDMHEVVARLIQSLSEMDREGYQLEQPHVHGLLAQAYLRLEQWGEACKAAEAGEAVNALSRPTFYAQLEAYAGPAQAYLGCWEAIGATSEGVDFAKRSQRACRELRKFARAFPVARPRSLRMDGLCEWLSGNKNRAQRKWASGIQLAQELGMPYEQGLTHLEVLRRLEPGDPSREAHQDEVGRIFHELETAFELAELERRS